MNLTPNPKYKDTSGGFWPTLLIATVALAILALLVSAPSSPAAGTTTVTTTPINTRSATAQEMLFCEANWDTLGPITNNCGYVPLWGGIEEDDAFGRWDCRLDGNGLCGRIEVVEGASEPFAAVSTPAESHVADGAQQPRISPVA